MLKYEGHYCVKHLHWYLTCTDFVMLEGLDDMLVSFKDLDRNMQNCLLHIVAIL